MQIASDISLPTLAVQHTPCRERKTEAELRGLRGLTAIGPISLCLFPLGFQRKERERDTGVDRRECELVGLVSVEGPLFYKVRFIVYLAVSYKVGVQILKVPSFRHPTTNSTAFAPVLGGCIVYYV